MRVARQFQHNWFGSFKGIAQFSQFNRFHLRKRFKELRLNDAVVENDEFGIRHVFFVVASHHLRQNEVNRCRSEQF